MYVDWSNVPSRGGKKNQCLEDNLKARRHWIKKRDVKKEGLKIHHSSASHGNNAFKRFFQGEHEQREVWEWELRLLMLFGH